MRLRESSATAVLVSAAVAIWQVRVYSLPEAVFSGMVPGWRLQPVWHWPAALMARAAHNAARYHDLVTVKMDSACAPARCDSLSHGEATACGRLCGGGFDTVRVETGCLRLRCRSPEDLADPRRYQV